MRRGSSSATTRSGIAADQLQLLGDVASEHRAARTGPSWSPPPPRSASRHRNHRQDLTNTSKLADATVQHWFAGSAAASTTAIKADLAPFKTDLSKCALALAIAALAPPNASSRSGTAVQGLVSVSPTAPPTDPAQVRRAFSVAARQLGWAPVRLASGVVL